MLATFSEHVHKKFEFNWTKIKGDCQSETKAAQQDLYCFILEISDEETL